MHFFSGGEGGAGGAGGVSAGGTVGDSGRGAGESGEDLKGEYSADYTRTVFLKGLEEMLGFASGFHVNGYRSIEKFECSRGSGAMKSLFHLLNFGVVSWSRGCDYKLHVFMIGWLSDMQ